MQVTGSWDVTAPYSLFDHPDVKNNHVQAMRLNLRQKIKEYTEQLSQTTDNKGEGLPCTND